MYVQFCDSTIDNVVFMKTVYIVSRIDGYLSFEWIPFMKLRSLSISPILLNTSHSVDTLHILLN